MPENYITCQDEKGSINISGIKVQIVDGTMTVDTIITVRYGCSVVAIAKAVQESVTSAVESMTGMGKPIVNVHVSGVAFDK